MQAHLVARSRCDICNKWTRYKEAESDDRQKDGTRLGCLSLTKLSRQTPCKYQKQDSQNDEIEDLYPAPWTDGKLTNECATRVIAGTKPAFERKYRYKERRPYHARPTCQYTPVAHFVHISSFAAKHQSGRKVDNPFGCSADCEASSCGIGKPPFVGWRSSPWDSSNVRPRSPSGDKRSSNWWTLQPL